MKRALIGLAVYLLGVVATAAFFGIGVARGELHINSADELGAIVAFCVFWPLTAAWIVFCLVVMLCLGWRGEPLHW